MQYAFQVQGMSCGHCEKAISQALQQVDPQAEVKIDRPSGRVEVNSSREAQALIAAIQAEGYTVST